MKNSDRMVVYFAGFVLGMFLVSFIMLRRAAKEDAATDPWVEHNAAMVESGAELLPASVPEALTKGRIIGFGFLPDTEQAEERVWLLNFDESYPFVRIVETLETGALRYMAADQIKIILAEGQDVAELKPMLDALNLRMRMFNRKEGLAVVGVLHTGIDAVPETLAAIQPWSENFDRAEPDWMLIKDQRQE